MTAQRPLAPIKTDGDEYVPYDTSTLSFGLSGATPTAVKIIRLMEWFTGKIRIVRIAKRFDDAGRVFEMTFWEKICEILKITIKISPEINVRIPATGPVVVVANHPCGFVYGLILNVLVGRIRPDLKILTRAFFATIP